MPMPAEFKPHEEYAAEHGLETLRAHLELGIFGGHHAIVRAYLTYLDRVAREQYEADQAELLRRSVEATEAAARAGRGATLVAWRALGVAICGVIIAVLTYIRPPIP